MTPVCPKHHEYDPENPDCVEHEHRNEAGALIYTSRCPLKWICEQAKILSAHAPARRASD